MKEQEINSAEASTVNIPFITEIPVSEVPVSASISSSMLTPVAAQMITTPPAKTLDSVIEMLSGVKNSDGVTSSSATSASVNTGSPSKAPSSTAAVPIATASPILTATATREKLNNTKKVFAANQVDLDEVDLDEVSKTPSSTAPAPIATTSPISTATLSTTTREKLNNTKKVFAANQVNLDEVSKKVAETRRAIQDTLNASPSKHGSPILQSKSASTVHTVSTSSGVAKSSSVPAILSVSSSSGFRTNSPTVTVTPLPTTTSSVTSVSTPKIGKVVADQNTPGGTLVPPVKTAAASSAQRSSAVVITTRKVCGRRRRRGGGGGEEEEEGDGREGKEEREGVEA